VALFEKRVEEFRQELANITLSLKSKEKTLNKMMSDVEAKLKDAETQTKKSLKEIDEACDSLVTIVQACRKRLKEKAVRSEQTVEVAVHNVKADLQKRRGAITSHNNLAERVRLTSPPGELEKATTMVRSRVAGIDVSVDSCPVVNHNPVHIDFGVVRRLQKELSFLGEKHTQDKVPPVSFLFR
jgi:DNA repair exonuclease SbcCD ATPase subunit